MRCWIVVAVVTTAPLIGCRQIFGLDEPALRADATTPNDAPGGDGSTDGPRMDGNTDCPGNYVVSTGTSGGARYRVNTSSAEFSVHHADCNNDLVGSTHLASPDGVQEILALAAIAGNESHFVGIVQQPNQLFPDAGWITFGGLALTAGQWDVDAGEPSDNSLGENNEENLGVIVADGLSDVTGKLAHRAICECDGKPVSATAATYIPP